MTNALKHRHVVTIIVVLIFIAAIASILLLWLYSGNLTPAKEGIFRFSRLPVATVGGSFITLNEIEDRSALAKTASANGTQAFQAIRNEKAVKNIAERHQVAVRTQELEQEYNNLVKQQGEHSDNFNKLILGSFNMTPQQFQTKVLLPDMRRDKLNVWYNSQREFNRLAFSQMDQVRQELGAGVSFGDVAKKYSDDQASQAFSGDLGFIDPIDLLPELHDGLINARAGETVYLTSRFGQHTIKIMEKNGGLLHLLALFIKEDGFANWYQEQVQTVPVKIFVRLN